MRAIAPLPRVLLLASMAVACSTNSAGLLSPAGSGDASVGADGAATGADGGTAGADGAATGADGAATGADGAATGADGAATGADGAATGADGAATGADGGVDIDAAGPPTDGAASIDRPSLSDARVGTCNRDEDCASNELGLNRCEPISGR